MGKKFIVEIEIDEDLMEQECPGVELREYISNELGRAARSFGGFYIVGLKEKTNVKPDECPICGKKNIGDITIVDY